MSSFKPPTTFVTTSGVTVTVDNTPPPGSAPTRSREAPAPAPTVVLRPPEAPARKQRDALVAKFVEEHGPFLRRMLLRRNDILAESAKDVEQRAYMVLSNHIDREGPPENVRGFLVRVIRREVANHKVAWRVPVEEGADGEAVAKSGVDPEQAALIAERWEKLMRYLERLSTEEADAYEHVELLGKSIDEAAAELKRPRDTVVKQLGRARVKLEAFAVASARAAEVGERRRAKR